jgi:hypothetical protein
VSSSAPAAPRPSTPASSRSHWPSSRSSSRRSTSTRPAATASDRVCRSWAASWSTAASSWRSPTGGSADGSAGGAPSIEYTFESMGRNLPDPSPNSKHQHQNVDGNFTGGSRSFRMIEPAEHSGVLSPAAALPIVLITWMCCVAGRTRPEAVADGADANSGQSRELEGAAAPHPLPPVSCSTRAASPPSTSRTPAWEPRRSASTSWRDHRQVQRPRRRRKAAGAVTSTALPAFCTTATLGHRPAPGVIAGRRYAAVRARNAGRVRPARRGPLGVRGFLGALSTVGRGRARPCSRSGFPGPRVRPPKWSKRQLFVRYEATVHSTAINIWLRSGGGFRSDPSDSLES